MKKRFHMQEGPHYFRNNSQRSVYKEEINVPRPKGHYVLFPINISKTLFWLKQEISIAIEIIAILCNCAVWL
jgi:hypothetical protein